MLKHPVYDSVTASICRVVILGTVFVIAAAVVLLLVSFGQNPEIKTRDCLLICGAAFAYVAISYIFLRQNYYHTVGCLLVLFYTLLATGTVWVWGVNTPIAPLFFALVIVLAGILLTARCALYAALVSGAVLLGIQAASNAHWHQPDISWMHDSTSYNDAFAYFTIFAMLALVSWLYNRELKRALIQAVHAETALLRQKATLKNQVKQRTMELRKAQLEEMQHMYRFAELGHLGVTLLHDLANHLTALTLEIESMHSKQHAETITRAQRIIHYLENIVDNTRGRLHGNTREHTFDVVRKVREVLVFLQPKAAETGVVIEWKKPERAWRYTGDPDSFSQVIAIITNNAIDAYGRTLPKSVAKKERRVVIAMQKTRTHIFISITDWGSGITKSDRKQLFKPRHSAKKTGLGLGLYIAKQIMEMQFLGSIEIGSANDHTEFIITLPQKKETASLSKSWYR